MDYNENFKIIEGNGAGITMSPVSDYILSFQPQQNNQKQFIFPKEKNIHKK